MVSNLVIIRMNIIVGLLFPPLWAALVLRWVLCHNTQVIFFYMFQGHILQSGFQYFKFQVFIGLNIKKHL